MSRRRERRSSLLNGAGGGLFAIALLSAPALALAGCAQVADKRSLMQRLAESRVAFIGTVKAVGIDSVRFAVEHAFNGAAARELAVARPAPGGCFDFAVGDRWLYAGARAGDPSLRLGRADETGPDAIGRLRRSDDARLQLPARWQACESDSQCVAIGYGCSSTAAAAPYEAEARTQAWKIGGDPRSMECSTQPATIQRIKPLCVAGRCGSWSVHLE